MNRSSKGFGLAGVLATVVLLIVAAIFSASAKSHSVYGALIPGGEAIQSDVQLDSWCLESRVRAI